MDLEINFRLKAGIRYDDTAGVHVTCCPALNVLSQGDTEAEAKRALESAIRMYLKVCYGRSILDDLLNRNGFSILRDGEEAGDDESCGDGEMIAVREIRPEYPHTYTIDIPIHLIQGKKIPSRRGDGAAWPS